ncbi:hypothetical protein [Bartonella sp. AD13SXNS]|uniref:hypothetical protein n=1 Tax=Bartonella sp. AD13SXNS TaxID=3243462 RepID=UPI0035CFD843
MKQCAISIIYSLFKKNSALDVLKSRKAELKGDGKAGDWFSLLRLYVLPKCGSLAVLEIT